MRDIDCLFCRVSIVKRLNSLENSIGYVMTVVV